MNSFTIPLLEDVPQFVATGAQCNKVFGIIDATLGARVDVVEFQKSGVVAALAPAAMPVPGQNFTANPRRDSGLVALTGFVDLSVFPGSFNLGLGELHFTLGSLNGCFGTGWTFVDVDLVVGI